MTRRQQLPPQIRKIETVHRATGRIVVCYELRTDGGINPQSGRRQQIKRRYATEKAARAALAEISDLSTRRAFVARTTITIEQLCDDWLASLRVRATTAASYAFVLAPLRERHGELAAQQLTRRHLDDLLTALQQGGTVTAKGNTRKPWMARSLNAAIDAWRLMLAYGCDTHALSFNEAAAMHKVARTHAEQRTYTQDEIRRLLNAADDDRNGHLWYLALSGLRRGEIAGLRWSDIDFDACELTISNNRVEIGGGPLIVIENEPKTRASRRTLPLDDGLINVLHRASARYTREKLILGGAHVDSGYVAVNEAGEPYTPGVISHLWAKAAKAAGVRVIRLHDARHSCGTAMHLRNVPMAVIAKWLGHADPSTTARLYTHSQDDALRDASQILGSIIISS